MLKLGTIVTDTVSQMKGMLTHYIIDTSLNENYIFQPKGLNPKDGQPVKSTWLDEKRIKDGVKDANVALPFNILGTQATDKASGYEGTIIQLTLHINGCVHATLKAKGKTEEGNSIDSVEIDIRRLKGPQIPKLTKSALEKSKVNKPSPAFKPERRY